MKKIFAFILPLLTGCSSLTQQNTLINHPNFVKLGIRNGYLVVSQPIITQKRATGSHRTILEIRSEIKPLFVEPLHFPQLQTTTINIRFRW